jgi:hypothetical protein
VANSRNTHDKAALHRALVQHTRAHGRARRNDAARYIGYAILALAMILLVIGLATA